MAARSLAVFEKQFPFDADSRQRILALLEAATRAPSTHNSQPWMFRVVGDAVEIFRDTNVKLPQSDAHTRYAHISIGFLLHHILVLGRFVGMHPEVSILVSGVSIARVRFSPAGTREEDILPLAQAIFARRNQRGTFQSGKKIPEMLLEQLAQRAPEMPAEFPRVELSIVTSPASAARIGKLTKETMIRLYSRPEFRREMSSWITPTGSGRRDGIPGFSLNQPLLLSWILPSLIRRFNIGKIPGKLSAAALASAPAIFGFGSDQDPASWLSIGFQASHDILTLVANGFDASIYVASVELPEIQREATGLCGLKKSLQFLFAAGKLESSASWYTPRVPLATRLSPQLPP
ncbi:hypothetical protein HY091_02535 [Candidatus Kaiserbacteria bacterium]|nr:hypothetical protein [Candidatus Kaiserbacteria bacterium]